MQKLHLSWKHEEYCKKWIVIKLLKTDLCFGSLVFTLLSHSILYSLWISLTNRVYISSLLINNIKTAFPLTYFSRKGLNFTLVCPLWSPVKFVVINDDQLKTALLRHFIRMSSEVTWNTRHSAMTSFVLIGLILHVS